ncbi:hypothetical protein GR183_04330 [Stappia sp. GBMRC 2046]|uniref:Uncharacterized protein n=1 Tax=Stappia sediminis TaxID=2692190 RepID=A0A7X3LS64_9HYPH|nr:hypothetical protein [Stappia sediminis]MXN64119.1 hypothetical protein [Stappia sediminis]
MRMIALALGVFGSGFAVMLFFSSDAERYLSLKSFDGLVDGAASAFVAEAPAEGGGILAWFGWGGDQGPEVMHLDEIVVSENGTSCSINGAVPGERVVFVNLYRADGKSPIQISDGSGKPTSMMNVNIGRYQSPVYLVLYAYEPVFWQLNVLKGTEISNILLVGNHSQAVANVPANVSPQILSGKGEDVGRCPDFEIAARSGEQASELERQIQTAIGRPISESKFVYEAKDVFLGADSKSLSRPSLIDGRYIYTHNELTQGSIVSGEAGLRRL